MAIYETILLTLLAIILGLLIISLAIFFYFSSYKKKLLHLKSDFEVSRDLVTERYKK